MTARPTDAPKRRRLPALLAAAGFVAVVGLAAAGSLGALRLWPAGVIPAPAQAAAVAVVPAKPLPAPVAALAKPIEKLTAVTVRLSRNQTLAQALVKLELPMTTVNSIIGSL
jgi:hypothetical protein